MTDSEQYQIIGQVVSQHEKAKRDLALLRAKAVAIGDVVATFGSALRFRSAFPESAQSSSAAFKVLDNQTVSANYDGRSHNGPWPTLEELSALIRDLREMTKTVEALAARRKDLGV